MVKFSGALDKKVLKKYYDLPNANPDECQAMYIWIDGTGEGLRCKTKTLSKPPNSIVDLPMWNYDGSSTYQAEGSNSDMYIIPRAMYKDPFRRAPNVLVLCDVYKYDQRVAETNFRSALSKTVERSAVSDHQPLVGFEQELTFMAQDSHPLGWAKMGFPGPQGPYYCAVGANRVFGRDIMESHYRACLYAGLTISGANAGTMPAQWQYQIGPLPGVEAADQCWISRFIMYRVAEEFGVGVSLDPKPVEGDWNGCGCYINFSTKEMREKDGLKHIEEAVENLSLHHLPHIKVYDCCGGEDNKRRLVGDHNTSNFDKFTSGVANRHVSVRIPRAVYDSGKGHLQDRRPAANCDPYRVVLAMMKTVILDEDFETQPAQPSAAVNPAIANLQNPAERKLSHSEVERQRQRRPSAV
ncbi:glutamine synthetase-like [Amphiura filiformis]|uniref:glutamine synthetase-like n=1 Tax=Amphiura filiformis TaxID=82378 RepID=UPI003B216BE0